MRPQESNLTQYQSYINSIQKSYDNPLLTPKKLSQVKGSAQGTGGFFSNHFDPPKVNSFRNHQEIQIPVRVIDTRQQEVQQKIIPNNPQKSSQKNFAYNGSHQKEDIVATPRATHIREMSSSQINFPMDDVIVRKISKGISQAQLSVKLGDTIKRVTKIQAIFRRQQAQKLFRKMLKNSRYRKCVFNEMVNSEEIYVTDLKIIHKEFIVAVQKVVSEQEIRQCFVNISSIIELNDRMLSALKSKPWHPNQQLISIVLDFAPFFKIYFEYCNNYAKMNAMIDKFKSKPKFFEFYRQISRLPKLRNLDIESFLVKPVQRLPKYVLLLKDYIKHTDQDHIEYSNVEKALNLFSKVNDENNQHMDRVVTNAKMFELQRLFGDQNSLMIVDPKRNFLIEEPMTVFWRNLPKSVIVYFLSDMLLITERDFQNNQMKLISPFYLSENSFIKDIPDHNNFQDIFSLIGDPETITFLCGDSTFKLKITNLLREIIEKLCDKNTQRQEVLDKMQKVSIVPRRKIWKIEVGVLGSEVRQETLTSYTVYVIEIAIEGIVCKIFLRYKEFTLLQDLTKKLFTNVILPYSTNKNWMGNLESKVVDSRKLQIQIFLQSLLGNPDFYEQIDKKKQQDVQTILKYMSLPDNFYELPSLLNKFESDSKVEEEGDKNYLDLNESNTVVVNIGNQTSAKGSKIFESIKTIQQGKNLSRINEGSGVDSKQEQLQKINQNLNHEYKWGNKNNNVMDGNLSQNSTIESTKKINSPSTIYQETNARLGRSMIRESSTNRRVSATKLLRSTTQKNGDQLQQHKFTLLVKLSNQDIELQITDTSRALDVAQEVSQRVGLIQYYDFKFVDEKSNRYLQDDEIILNLFRIKESEKRQFVTNIIQKVKSVISDKYTILYKKVLFLPKTLECKEYLNDEVRLSLLVAQLMKEIMLSKILFSFKQYCTIAALQIFIIQMKTLSRTITFEQIQQFIPNSLLNATKKEIWINQVLDQVNRLRVQFEEDKEILGLGLEINIAQKVIMNIGQSIKLYGIHLFQAQNSPENKFKQKTIPSLILIGVSIEGIHVLDQQKKVISKTFYSDRIDDIKVFTDYLEIDVIENLGETITYKFLSSQSYLIFQLYEEYEQILQEVQQAQFDKD